MILQENDRFKIDSSAHRNKTYRVVEVQKDASEKEFSYKCYDEKDNTQFFSQTNMNFYGDKIKKLGGKK